MVRSGHHPALIPAVGHHGGRRGGVIRLGTDDPGRFVVNPQTNAGGGGECLKRHGRHHPQQHEDSEGLVHAGQCSTAGQACPNRGAPFAGSGSAKHSLPGQHQAPAPGWTRTGPRAWAAATAKRGRPGNRHLNLSSQMRTFSDATLRRRLFARRPAPSKRIGRAQHDNARIGFVVEGPHEGAQIVGILSVVVS